MLDQSQKEDKLGKQVLLINYQKVIQKHANFYLRHTFDENPQKKGTVYISDYPPTSTTSCLWAGQREITH